MPFCVSEVEFGHQNGHIAYSSVPLVMSCSVCSGIRYAVDTDIFFLLDNLTVDLFDTGTVLCLVALFVVIDVWILSVTPEDSLTLHLDRAHRVLIGCCLTSLALEVFATLHCEPSWLWVGWEQLIGTWALVQEWLDRMLHLERQPWRWWE